MALYNLGEKVCIVFCRNRYLTSTSAGLLWPVQLMLVKLTNQNKA